MVVQVKDLKKNYGAFSLDCSLEVRKGYVTGLIGQNGAGKSTTFKALLGLISTDAGEVKVFDKDIREFAAKDKSQIGVVLSDSGFCNYLKIKDITKIMAGLYDSFDKEKFLERCRQSNLPMNKKIKDFSTGMKAKLKVLLALSHDTKLLVLDEPTAGLDVVARDEILDMLRDYMEDENHSILISSHISTDLEGLCDDLFLIHKGKITLHEDTDVLMGQYAVLKVDEKQYQKIDRKYILRVKKEEFGYSCLTSQKQFYLENYPDIVVEKGNIDDLILMTIKGEAV